LVVVGHADDPKSEMGPLVDRANVARIDRFVEDAKRYAPIIVRGGPITDGPLAAGAFYRPSMLETEELDVPLIPEEIFGPVLSFETFATEEEAITRANATFIVVPVVDGHFRRADGFGNRQLSSVWPLRSSPKI
jgi:betaine-aldehyde dehydrogenase